MSNERLNKRLSLHSELELILGSKNVYFQPPESIKMRYPAIIYSRDDISTIKADDLNYLFFDRYQVIIVDPDPDNDYLDTILCSFKHCSYDRHYVADNLNHDVFTIYY